MIDELTSFYSFNTVASTGTYALADTVAWLKKPAKIDDGDGDAVENIALFQGEQDRIDFWNLYPEDDSASEDQPAGILEASLNLYLRPIPDAVYTIKIWSSQRPDELATDSLLTHEKWFYALAYGTGLQMLKDAKQPYLDIESAHKDFLVDIGTLDTNKVQNSRPRPRF